MVFLVGAGMSILSLILARLIPENPTQENVALVGPYKTIISAAK
jgi:hypothetical protein